MMKHDLFKEFADMDIDKIAQEFPVLTDDEKERIYAMSERKYNLKNNSDTDFNNDGETVVSGVEQYKRPTWYKYASIAAAAVLTVGGISGSIMLMSKNSSVTPSADVSTSTDTTEEKTTQEDTSTTAEETTEAVTEGDEKVSEYAPGSYEAIALDLTDRFADLANKLNGDVKYNPNDELTFNIYSFDDPEYGDHWSHFAKVIEPGFQTKEDFLNAFRDICTEEYFNILEETGGNEYAPNTKYGPNLPPSDGYLALDFSQYENDSDIDMASFDWHTEALITYNGRLYNRTDYLNDSTSIWPTYSDDPTVTENGDGTFTATRCALFNPVCNAQPSKVGNPLIFTFKNENGQWKIDDIVQDGNVDLNAELAIVRYFSEVNTEYNDMNIALDKIIYEDIDIIKHNYNYSFTVHYIVTADDADNTPLLDFTADVVPQPDTQNLNAGMPDYHFPVGFEYSNVEIKEIKR